MASRHGPRPNRPGPCRHPAGCRRRTRRRGIPRARIGDGTPTPRSGRPGAATPRGAALTRLLAARAEPAFTRSEAERRLLTLLRSAHLEPTATNARLAGYEVDLLWRAERLVVEVDGWQFHGTREAFGRDRTRDAALIAAGFRVLRVTWRQIAAEPAVVVANAARALAQSDR